MFSLHSKNPKIFEILSFLCLSLGFLDISIAPSASRCRGGVLFFGGSYFGKVNTLYEAVRLLGYAGWVAIGKPPACFQGARCVFTWNLSKVPDPPGLVAEFRQHNLHLIPNVKPWLLTCHPKYVTCQRGVSGRFHFFSPCIPSFISFLLVHFPQPFSLLIFFRYAEVVELGGFLRNDDGTVHTEEMWCVQSRDAVVCAACAWELLIFYFIAYSKS